MIWFLGEFYVMKVDFKSIYCLMTMNISDIIVTDIIKYKTKLFCQLLYFILLLSSFDRLHRPNQSININLKYTFNHNGKRKCRITHLTYIPSNANIQSIMSLNQCNGVYLIFLWLLDNQRKKNRSESNAISLRFYNCWLRASWLCSCQSFI